jgi:hypothetical protein
MWRPRDRERYIGGYDPEHEMPDPDRGPGDRWQSDAYRHNARDGRFAYRMNPDYVERQFDGPRGGYDRGWDRGGDPRDFGGRDYYDRGGYGYRPSEYDRGGYGRGGYGGGGYGGGYGYRGPERDFDRGFSDRGGWDRGGGMNRMTGPHFDRFSADRGIDHDRWGPDRFRDREYGADDWHDDWRRRR